MENTKIVSIRERDTVTRQFVNLSVSLGMHILFNMVFQRPSREFLGETRLHDFLGGL